jgi:hypothetical protein
MGTNFYLRTDPCPHCGRSDEEIHLGKLSIGWAFTFRARPDADPPVTDFETWCKQLDGGTIYDEYSCEISREHLLKLIEERRGLHNQLSRNDFYDQNGYHFAPEEFS